MKASGVRDKVTQSAQKFQPQQLLVSRKVQKHSQELIFQPLTVAADVENVAVADSHHVTQLPQRLKRSKHTIKEIHVTMRHERSHAGQHSPLSRMDSETLIRNG